MKDYRKNFGKITIETTIFIVFAIIVIGILTVVAKPTLSSIPSVAESRSAKSESITVSDNDYDFGTISMINGKVEHIFRIVNDGNVPINIEKLYTSCMCTEAVLELGENDYGPYGMPGHGFMPSINQTIKPGESANIRVIFDPAAHGPAGVGPVQREIIIESSDGETDMSFKALVRP